MYRCSLESRDFRLSRSKTEYLRCGFNGVEMVGGEVTMGGVMVPQVEKFKYLRSIVKERGDMMRILAIVLGRDGKNGGRLLEYFATKRFLLD